MIQLYEQMPPELGLGDGMYCIDTGDYCKADDAYRLLQRFYAQLDFLQGNMELVWYGMPEEIETLTSHSVVYCNAHQMQRLLDKLYTQIQFLRDQIPDVGSDRWMWNKAVRC